MLKVDGSQMIVGLYILDFAASGGCQPCGLAA